MKKIFTFVAVLLLAANVGAANWTETFDKNGTSVQRTQGGDWPLADQWFTGYTGETGEVKGSQYVQTYTDVTSTKVSIRSKKVDGASKSLPGLYFGKINDKYVKFTMNNLEALAGAELTATICNPDDDVTTNANWIYVAFNGEDSVALSNVEVKGQLASTTATVAVPKGKITSIKFSMGAKDNPLFINKLEISNATITAIPEVLAEKSFNKAVKMFENGRVVIIRNGVKYNAVGGVIE